MSGNAHVRFGGAGWGNLRPETVAWRPAPTLLQPLTSQQTADLLEVIEDRAQLRSTVVTSQLPVPLWHEALGEPTVADAILDRLLHNAHSLELRGDSMRKSERRRLERAHATAETPKMLTGRGDSRKRAAETASEARWWATETYRICPPESLKTLWPPCHTTPRPSTRK